ncbi:MAG: GNAT family N-acetyltransferase [Deinococcota bacterium]
MLRPYQPADLPALTHFIGECWQQDKFANYHPYDFVHWMSNGHLGENLEHHFYTVQDAEQLAAVVHLNTNFGSYEFVIAPDKRGSTWELELHRQCTRIMKQSMANTESKKIEAKTLIVTTVKGDDATQKCLKQLGFKASSTDYVMTKRSLEHIPEPHLPDGFHIRSVAGTHDAKQLADVHNSAFSPKWTEESYRKVMQTPGFVLENELVITTSDGRFAAFVIVWLDPVSRCGLFEPVGCHGDFRRRGLTKALTFAGMARMKNAGMEAANVCYKLSNEAAFKLYTSVGFETYFETVDYGLEL